MRRITLLPIALTLCLAAMLTACEEKRQVRPQELDADSLIDVAYKARDYEHILSLADRYQSAGTLSDLKACYWRGYAYSRQQKMRLAEMEWKEAISLDVNNEEDLEYFSKSANRLAGQLHMKGDYEGTIRVATAAMKLMKEKKYAMHSDYANLQTFVGNCQLKLGHTQEAARSYAMAYQHFMLLTETDDIANITSSIIGIITITDTYIQTGNYPEAYEWTERLDNMLQRYRQHQQADDSFIDKQWARLNLYRACALEGLDRQSEARKAYQTALITHYGKTNDGKIEATNYLMAAKRWREAADNFAILEEQMLLFNARMTLDNIQKYLLPKYQANMGAHRTDSALATGRWICTALDSALVWERQNTAMELATIYDTQRKETELMEQKASLSHQRLLTAIITLVLVILGFGLFIYTRQRAAIRLKKAYHDLEVANARAEVSSRMKSNFIQQISHEIRTPLNILSGFTQVITTPDMELDDDTRADINQQITENTGRITSLVNKMLELSDANSQADIAQDDTVTAIQIAAEAADATAIAEAGHLTFDLQVSAEAETAMLKTNQQAAVRALSLVLDNARKFTAPAEAHQRNEETSNKTGDTAGAERKHVLLRVDTEGQQVLFAVEDNGIGIPAHESERIFEEFVQLDEYYDGTGIGLTVARSLARRLGGDIRLDTSYTSGARFILTLPRS